MSGLSEEARRAAAELHLVTGAVRARHERAAQQRRAVVAARWAEVVSRADRGPEELQVEIEHAHEHLPAVQVLEVADLADADAGGAGADGGAPRP